MSIITLVLLAFVCGLLAAKTFDLFKTLLTRLRSVRLEIDLGNEGTLASQKQIAPRGVNPKAPQRSLRGAGLRPALTSDRTSDENEGDESAI